MGSGGQLSLPVQSGCLCAFDVAENMQAKMQKCRQQSTVNSQQAVAVNRRLHDGQAQPQRRGGPDGGKQR